MSRPASWAAAARWGEPLGIFAGSRLVVAAALWTMVRVVPGAQPASEALGFWDGIWYRAVALQGYPDHVPKEAGRAIKSNLAFFPVYPLLLRAVHAVGLGEIRAGLLVTTVCAACFAVVLWALVTRLHGEDTARRAVVLTCFFPGAFVLSFVYSEATMLLAIVLGLLLLVERRWVLAGLAGAVASATRPNGLAFAAAALVVAIIAVRDSREAGLSRWVPFVAPALSGLGIAGFFAFLWVRTGEADAWFQVERWGWNDRFAPQARITELHAFVQRPFYDTYVTTVVLGLAFIAVTLALMWRARMHVALVAYTLASLGFSLVSHEIGGRPRFILVAFPLIVALAIHLRGTAYAVTAAAFGAGLAVFMVLVTAGPYVTP